MLPEILPDNPLPLFREWFDEARDRALTANPNAMTLVTVDAGQQPPRPNARIVLCKGISNDPGYVVFYTNYRSVKAQEIDSAPRAAAVFFWDALDRQVRINGPIVRSPALESDAYFASRGVGSRLGAWASQQSRPIADRAALLRQVDEQAERFGVPHAGGVVSPDSEAEIPRPPHWGGYRLWIEEIELWCGVQNRIHDRARWRRALAANVAQQDGHWVHTRLQP